MGTKDFLDKFLKDHMPIQYEVKADGLYEVERTMENAMKRL